MRTSHNYIISAYILPENKILLNWLPQVLKWIENRWYTAGIKGRAIADPALLQLQSMVARILLSDIPLL